MHGRRGKLTKMEKKQKWTQRPGNRKVFSTPKKKSQDIMTTTGISLTFPLMISWITRILSSGFRSFQIRKNWNGEPSGVWFDTEDEDGYLVEPDIGFCPLPSGMSISWDREKYPYLSLLDNSDLSHVAEANDEETMQTHFISMLSYIRDHDEILSMMGQTTDSPNRYQDMINYVKKNGLKIHGFAVSAKKKALLELYQEAMVSYIQTVPQN